MEMRTRTIAFAAFLALSTFLARTTLAQDPPAESESIPLTAQPGVPLHIALERSAPIKRAGMPVEGRVVEPIYVFDQMVIPAGSQILGHVSQVESLARKRRALAIANGDFSPLRKAQVDFDTLVLKDGRRLPLHTAVSQGVPNVVHLAAGERGKKNGRVGGVVAQARQEVKAREQRAIKEVKAPGKMQRLKSKLAAQLPYHKQRIEAGTRFTAELTAPVELGKEDPSPKQLERLGSEIPSESIVHVRLLSPLSSATDRKGSPVKAVVSQPVFTSDHELILPEGARVEGIVTQAQPARRLGRNGQLRFSFRQLEFSNKTPRPVEASLQGVEASSDAHLELDAEGGAHAVTPKTNYIGPAIHVLLATSSLDGLESHHRRDIDTGAREGGDTAAGAVRGGVGFGLIGSVIGSVAHYRPINAAFALYGAGWSVYSHVLARGNDVVFRKDTPMEIRFGTHENSMPPASSTTPAAPKASTPTKSS